MRNGVLLAYCPDMQILICPFVNRRPHINSIIFHALKMVRMSVLADCLKTITNAEKRGKRQVLIRPSSKVVIKFLQCMQVHGKLIKAPMSR